MTTDPLDAAGAHRLLPTKRMGSGAVIRDADGRVLIVEPTYKPAWELPGGAVERDESPADACARELREELGIDVDVGSLLCVDYNSSTPDWMNCRSTGSFMRAKRPNCSASVSADDSPRCWPIAPAPASTWRISCHPTDRNGDGARSAPSMV